MHYLPLLITSCIRLRSLKLTDVCLPISLPWKCGKNSHIPFKIELIIGIHDHK